MSCIGFSTRRESYTIDQITTLSRHVNIIRFQASECVDDSLHTAPFLSLFNFLT